MAPPPWPTLSAGIAAAFGLLAAPATAAPLVGDLDLLARGTVKPNVMIVFDNSGSMRTALDGSTRLDIAGDAAKALVEQLYPDDGAGGYDATVRLGLFTFDWSDDANGGQLAEAIADDNKQELLDAIDATVAKTHIIGEQAKGTMLAETMADVGRYFAGEHGFGTYPAVATASPIDLECRENFIVFMTDGETNQDKNDHHGSPVAGTTAYDNFIDTIGNADGDSNECDADGVACIDDPQTGRDDGDDYGSSGTDWMDDVAYYLHNTDLVPDASLDGMQNVDTYTIGFANSHILLRETADNGNGEFFFADDAASLTTSLQTAFNSIFDEIETSFSSAVVPGSTIGTGNALYNSYFESSGEPVWEGHLEALRIAQNGEIQDSNLVMAVDPATGELLDTRVPFWDAAVQLRTNTSRTIYMTKGGARVDFRQANLDATDLDIVAPNYANYPANTTSGIDTTAELEQAIVRYVRGKDGFDEDDDGDYTEMRAIVLGDIFHSTPKAIAQPTRLNITEPGFQTFYTTYYDRDRVVYAGANDGLLHAFDAGVHAFGDDASTPEIEVQHYTPGSGDELWGWVPGVQLDRMKLLPQNSPRSEFFVDGPISVADAWVGDGTGNDVTKTTDEWATVMISGMREGGTGYLALDITDPGATMGEDHYPYPNLLWEFTDADLGQSWSEAVITRVKLRAAGGTGDKCGPDDFDGDCREQWVAIFAGGYEPEGDPNRPASYVSNPLDASWSDTSKALYMVQLDTGAIVGKVEYDGVDTPDMKYSIPSAPAVIDLDFDGFADVVYVGDLGGQMWKWDIHAVGENSDADPQMDNWPSGVFFRTASVTLTNGDEHYRSFFYPPVGSFHKGELILAFGSGERHNLGYQGDGAEPDENSFYVAKDVSPIGVGAFASILGDGDLTDVTALDIDTVPGDLGYRFTLAESEKFVTEITVFAGFVIVGSYTPLSGADVCATASGQSFLHVFNLATGAGFFSDPADPPSEDRRTYVGGGFPTSPEVTVATDPDDDVIIVKTSEGPKVISIDAPPRNEPKGSFIYWKVQE
jgi:type IV pilus assembly protein PilY1